MKRGAVRGVVRGILRGMRRRNAARCFDGPARWRRNGRQTVAAHTAGGPAREIKSPSVPPLPAPPSMTASEREPWVVKRERRNTKRAESNRSVAQSSYAACTAPDAKKFEYSAGKRKWASARRIIESYSHCRAAVLFRAFGRESSVTAANAGAKMDHGIGRKPLEDNGFMIKNGCDPPAPTVSAVWHFEIYALSPVFAERFRDVAQLKSVSSGLGARQFWPCCVITCRPPFSQDYKA